MQSVTFPETLAQHLLAIITQRLAPCTVYVFGYCTYIVPNPKSCEGKITHHFYLVAFSSKQGRGSASNLENLIAEQSGKILTATVLMHKVTDLATKNAGQIRFFDKVFRNGHRLCLDKANVPYLLADTIPLQNRREEDTFWLKCEAVAQFNINAATESQHLEVELCKIALLNTACVQIALGLIKVCIGYTPNEYGLNYLLKICSHFTEMPSKLFTQNTPKAAKRYEMLCAPPSMLNHWTKLKTNEADFKYLLDATEQFLELAKEIKDTQYSQGSS